VTFPSLQLNNETVFHSYPHTNPDIIEKDSYRPTGCMAEERQGGEGCMNESEKEMFTE
jgi:hypothetical protein